MSSTWPGMKWVRNERSFAHGQAALVIGRPRPLQILGYRRISPGFWWLSNASALAFEHRECSGRDDSADLARGSERERERIRVRTYVCGMEGRVEGFDGGAGGGGGRGREIVGLRWISGTHIYPSVAERDTGIGYDGGTCERGKSGGKSSRRRYR